MRDPERIPVILEKVAEVWKAYPDLRLGQLVCNLLRYADGWEPELFYIEDYKMLEFLIKEIEGINGKSN